MASASSGARRGRPARRRSEPGGTAAPGGWSRGSARPPVSRAPDELVAGGEHADTGPPMDGDLLDAEGGEQPEVSSGDRGARREDLVADLDVVASGTNVLAGGGRPAEADSVTVVEHLHDLDRHHGVGSGRHRRTGHDPLRARAEVGRRRLPGQDPAGGSSSTGAPRERRPGLLTAPRSRPSLRVVEGRYRLRRHDPLGGDPTHGVGRGDGFDRNRSRRVEHVLASVVQRHQHGAEPRGAAASRPRGHAARPGTRGRGRGVAGPARRWP